MKKFLLRFLLVLLAVVILSTAVTFGLHWFQSRPELERLKKNGYVNPVSVGDYEVNVAKFGRTDGEHTVVAMAGLSIGDFSVTGRKMTAELEERNLVVFVDRAGCGLSDDTGAERSLSNIVEEYRTALKNTGLEGPYVLMAHSMAGVYASYWASTYPDEIEAVVLLDGSVPVAYVDQSKAKAGFVDRVLALLAKVGFERYALRSFYPRLPDPFSDGEQRACDVLQMNTLDSVARAAEKNGVNKNLKDAWDGIVTNEIPKLYLCSTAGFKKSEEILEYNAWKNAWIEKCGSGEALLPTDLDPEDPKLLNQLAEYEQRRQDVITPYAEKMGNCSIVCVPGDHKIYLQKPAECGWIIQEFLDRLGK